MILNEDLPLWAMIIGFIGLIFGLFSSLMVMVSIIKLPFKDISTELRKYSTLSDILLCFAIACVSFATDTGTWCVLHYLISTSFNLHAFWVFYMSYVMRKIIYLKKAQDKAYIKYAYAILFVTAGGISASIFINSDLCVLRYDLASFYYQIFTIALPNAMILTFIIIFYWNIRKALIIEIHNCDDIGNQRKILFTRIYGYPLIFSLNILYSLLTNINFVTSDSRSPIDSIRVISLSYIPLLNSLFYGLMPSSKRVLRFLISKDFDYFKEEEILNDLRSEKFILPRVIFDLVDEHESRIFRNKEK